MIKNLTGQVALVTGATGGIGRAIARKLHKLGAYVYLSGTNQEKLEKLKTELGERTAIKPADLSNLQASNELLQDIDKLDIVVCNAGITRDNLSIRMKDEDFAAVLSVNLQSSFVLNREAIKKMIKARYGRIINVSSVVAVSGNPGQANYCASKAGLIAMSKSLAAEVASRNITINCVAPGFITSNMTNELNDAQQKAILQKIPAKEFGKPEDIANAVAFLASPASSYITGHTLHVNGGMLMV